MRFRWNTTAIKDALQAALPDCTLVVNEPGGDWDTEEVVVMRNAKLVDHGNFKTWDSEASCSVFGMWLDHSQGSIETPDDVDVDLVFACESPKDGMVNAKPDDMILCGQVAKTLSGLGVLHVNNQGWKAYF